MKRSIIVQERGCGVRTLCLDFLIHRDKASFDIFWLRDESLDEFDNSPDPLRTAVQTFKCSMFKKSLNSEETVEDLEATLEQSHEFTADISANKDQ